ncbi:hypothetical protein ACFWGI_06770 [Streptomyces niveus]|uniref:hypothetical protein n=1 Tax=Streptomyces niveus TaxID=193462 RepID=UPI003662312D
MNNPRPTSANNLADVAAIPDPLERFRAAQAAGKAVAARYARLQNEALHELALAHAPVTGKNVGEPNYAAAAREVGLTPTAVHKRLKGEDPAARPAGTPAVQAEPARRFDGADDAEAALDDWALRRQDVMDEAEPLLLGALAAGADPLTIHERTGESLELLRRIRPAGKIQVSRIGDFDEVVEDFARLVTAHAAALNEHAAPGAERSAAQVWHRSAAQIVTNAAPYALLPPVPIVRAEDYDTPGAYADAVLNSPGEEQTDTWSGQDEVATVSGPDAWLAKFTVQLAREARRGVPDYMPAEHREHAEAVGRASGEVAAAVRHLRATGTLPVLEA